MIVDSIHFPLFQTLRHSADRSTRQFHNQKKKEKKNWIDIGTKISKWVWLKNFLLGFNVFIRPSISIQLFICEETKSAEPNLRLEYFP